MWKAEEESKEYREVGLGVVKIKYVYSFLQLSDSLSLSGC